MQAIFSNHRALTKQRVTAVAQGIAELLLSRTSDLAVYEQADLTGVRHGSATPELASLAATRVPSHDVGVWYPAGGGWVNDVLKEALQRSVGAKHAKVGAYRQRCEEIWLLVVFSAVSNDTVVRAPAEEPGFSLESDFDRIFRLETLGARVVEIRTYDSRARDV